LVEWTGFFTVQLDSQRPCLPRKLPAGHDNVCQCSSQDIGSHATHLKKKGTPKGTFLEAKLD